MYETILVHHDDYIFHYPLLLSDSLKLIPYRNCLILFDK